MKTINQYTQMVIDEQDRAGGRPSMYAQKLHGQKRTEKPETQGISTTSGDVRRYYEMLQNNKLTRVDSGYQKIPSILLR